MNDIQNYSVPTVIERDGRGNDRVWDLYSRLLVDRIIFIGTPIDDHVSNIVVAQLLFMQMSDPKKDIHIYINSPGGSVTSGLAIYDTMQYLTCDVNTYCVGQAASMGAVLLCAGTKGKRFALPNSNIMIHQVLGGAEGAASAVGTFTPGCSWTASCSSAPRWMTWFPTSSSPSCSSFRCPIRKRTFIFTSIPLAAA